MSEQFLKNQVALVTGGGRGIGRAVAGALAAQGARVYLVGRKADSLESAAREIAAQGGAAVPVVCDVACEADVLRAYGQIDAESGRIDILFNNAAIATFANLVDVTVEDWDRVMGVNVRGAFLCLREAMRRMQKQKGGRIINMGSIVSRKGYPNQGLYTTTKHAIYGLTKVAAVEGQKDNIIVQAILPGGVDTELVGSSRPDLDTTVLMKPEDVAEAALFLLRQEGNAITDFLELRRRTSAPFA